MCLKSGHALAACGIVVLTCFVGCEPQAETPAPPAPMLSRGGDTEEVPPPVIEMPTVVDPAPAEPAPMPPSSLPKVTMPTVTVRDRKYQLGPSAGGRGMRFFLTFHVDNNPDQLELQVTIRDRNGDSIPPLKPKNVGQLWGVDHFVPGVGLAGGPYSFVVSVYDPDRETWFPLSNWVEFQSGP